MNPVETQKAIAKEVLEELEIIDPNCILAGGAPRDWFFGKPATDLDFYLYDSYGGYTQSQWIERLNKTLLDVKPLGMIEGKARKEIDAEYTSMANLRYVFEGEHYGVKVQVMVMSEPTFTSVVNNFCMDTSKIWWKGGRVQPTWEFLRAHATRTLRICPEHAPKERYIDKMVAKFPTYRLVTDNREYAARIENFLKFNEVPNENRLINKWIDNHRSIDRDATSMPFVFDWGLV